ncbi:hypothetical protein [Sphingomonas bacterium]|uniref:hypothetical protein n=1 Tax=Sphingomonas bacterium TaxID=1895847 RepID=UPI00157627C1|nr:hypothetical protein [Sphingomonas bacterium]
MRTLIQRTGSDCGVATLAMLAGKTYNDAANFMLAQYPEAKLVSTGKIVAGLRYFGIEPLQKRSRALVGVKLVELRHDALLQGSHKKDAVRPDHWAVWDCKHKKVRDPWGEDIPFYPSHYMLVR